MIARVSGKTNTRISYYKRKAIYHVTTVLIRSQVNVRIYCFHMISSKNKIAILWYKNTRPLALLDFFNSFLLLLLLLLLFWFVFAFVFVLLFFEMEYFLILWICYHETLDLDKTICWTNIDDIWGKHTVLLLLKIITALLFSWWLSLIMTQPTWKVTFLSLSSRRFLLYFLVPINGCSSSDPFLVFCTISAACKSALLWVVLRHARRRRNTKVHPTAIKRLQSES